MRNSEYYSLDARAKEGQLLESLQALLTEAERVRRHGFLATELDRAKTNTLRGYERAYQERDKTPSGAFVDEYIDNFLQGEAIPGIAFEYAAMQRLLPTVTLAEVNALGASRVGEANRVVTVSLPEKDGLAVPTDAAIRAVFGKVNGATIAPWVETVTAGALVAKAPTAGRVVSEKKTESLNLTEWTLSNGIKVFVKPTDFTADQIVITLADPQGHRSLIGVNPKIGELFFDRTRSGPHVHDAFPDRHTAPLRLEGGRIKLRVFIDQSIKANNVTSIKVKVAHTVRTLAFLETLCQKVSRESACYVDPNLVSLGYTFRNGEVEYVRDEIGRAHV